MMHSGRSVMGGKLAGVTTEASLWPSGTINFRTLSAASMFTSRDSGSTQSGVLSRRLPPALGILLGRGMIWNGGGIVVL